MFIPSRPSWVGTWALLAAGAAAAQSAPPPQAPDPAPSSFRSALEGYQPYAEQPVGSWRDANDTVGRIGGWRAYAREAAASAAEPRPSSAPAAKDPHAGHCKPPGAPR